jgi:hypothetical protein
MEGRGKRRVRKDLPRYLSLLYSKAVMPEHPNHGRYITINGGIQQKSKTDHNDNNSRTLAARLVFRSVQQQKKCDRQSHLIFSVAAYWSERFASR